MAGPRSQASTSTGLWLEALAAAARRQLAAEWRGSRLHLASLEQPRASGWAAAPHDPRPADASIAEAILGGVIALGGETLTVPDGADPWSRPSPSRRFAMALHRFDWLSGLMAGGEAGGREALRLVLAWERSFGRWNAFAWERDVLARRVFNLACAGRALTALGVGSDAARLAQSLARQARHLASLIDTPTAAETLTAAAVAGTALAGAAGTRLSSQALAKLSAALTASVGADGVHASRSPEAGMALLLDLTALEDGLGQRGATTPAPVLGAITRLTAGLRTLVLSDGRLAALQGGETGERARVAAALLHDAPASGEPARTPAEAAGGYQRLSTPGLEVVVDAGPPASGVWSLAACGQPMAIEVACGRDRLITSSGWSPAAQGPQALRLAGAASTAAVGLGHVGAPLGGFAGRALGPRLIGGVTSVAATRRESDAGIWLDMAHDGWVSSAGLMHERRLFLDKGASELRGEDRFVPVAGARAASTPVAIYFHLHPDVTVRLARDQRSVLLRGPSDIGWWLRNDAGEVLIEASTHMQDGRPRRCESVVMRGRLRADRGGRVRWKLTLAEPDAKGPPTAIDRRRAGA